MMGAQVFPDGCEVVHTCNLNELVHMFVTHVVDDDFCEYHMKNKRPTVHLMFPHEELTKFYLIDSLFFYIQM